jgi:hypothetical protein
VTPGALRQRAQAIVPWKLLARIRASRRDRERIAADIAALKPLLASGGRAISSIIAATQAFRAQADAMRAAFRR